MYVLFRSWCLPPHPPISMLQRDVQHRKQVKRTVLRTRPSTLRCGVAGDVGLDRRRKLLGAMASFALHTRDFTTSHIANATFRHFLFQVAISICFSPCSDGLDSKSPIWLLNVAIYIWLSVFLILCSCWPLLECGRNRMQSIRRSDWRARELPVKSYQHHYELDL